MNILIAGGTGFIGQAMTHHFLADHHKITILGRSKEKITAIFSNKVDALTWEELNSAQLNIIQNTHLIINLTGASIGEHRWTPTRKKEILESRIQATTTLANLCAQLGKDSPPLFSASAVSVYGLQQGHANGLPPAYDENTPIDFQSAPNFLTEISRKWEWATKPAMDASVRVVNMRFAVVLGRNGGVLKKLKLPFLFCFGGTIGEGHQPFSWIALPDLLNAVGFLIQHPEINGPVNLVAPTCITQKQFAQALGKALNRPSIMPTPAFLLKLSFGEMAEDLLLNGQHVLPTILTQYGFQFQYSDIQSALNEFAK